MSTLAASTRAQEKTLCDVVAGANETECRARAKMAAEDIPPEAFEQPVALSNVAGAWSGAIVLPSDTIDDSCTPVVWLRENMAEVERVRGAILGRGVIYLEVADVSDIAPTIIFDLRSPKFRIGKLPTMIDPPELEKVPFYLYPLPQWIENCRGFVGATHTFGPDVYLTQMWSAHPWRVLDPEEAQVFVIPGYFGLSAENHCGNHMDNMNETVGALRYFNKSRRNHLLVGQHFKIKEARAMGRLESYMPYLVQASHVRVNYLARKTVPIPYGDVLDMYEDGEKTCDVAFHDRMFSIFFMGRVDGRVYYVARNKALLWLGRHFHDAALITSAVGRFPECPDIAELSPSAFSHGCYMKESRHKYMELLRQSRFGLMIGGDTPDSSRIYDYISCGILPVVISPQYRDVAMPFAHDVCWENFATFIDPETFHDYPVESMIIATDLNTEEIERRLQAITRVRQFLDYTAQHTLLPHLLLRDIVTTYHSTMPVMDPCPNRGDMINLETLRQRGYL